MSGRNTYFQLDVSLGHKNDTYVGSECPMDNREGHAAQPRGV